MDSSVDSCSYHLRSLLSSWRMGPLILLFKVNPSLVARAAIFRASIYKINSRYGRSCDICMYSFQNKEIFVSGGPVVQV